MGLMFHGILLGRVGERRLFLNYDSYLGIFSTHKVVKPTQVHIGGVQLHLGFKKLAKDIGYSLNITAKSKYRCARAKNCQIIPKYIAKEDIDCQNLAHVFPMLPNRSFNHTSSLQHQFAHQLTISSLVAATGFDS